MSTKLLVLGSKGKQIVIPCTEINVKISFHREALKRIAATLIFDTVEYKVVDMVVEPTLKTIFAKLDIIDNILQFEVEG